MKKQSAVTVIEILVVISIFAILAGLLLPAIFRAKIIQHNQQFKIGEVVSIQFPNDIKINGIINEYKDGHYSIITIISNGIPSKLDYINPTLLKKEQKW